MHRRSLTTIITVALAAVVVLAALLDSEAGPPAAPPLKAGEHTGVLPEHGGSSRIPVDLTTVDAAVQSTADELVGKSGIERIRAFLDMCRIEADYVALSDPYLENVRIDSVVEAVRKSGLRFEDVRAGLAEPSVFKLSSEDKVRLSLAMAFVPGVLSTDEDWVLGFVVGHLGVLDNPSAEDGVADQVLASAHAIRLRGRLHAAIALGFWEALEHARVESNREVFGGGTACLIQMLCREAFLVGLSSADGQRLADGLMVQPRMRPGSMAPVVQLLLEINEPKVVADIDALLNRRGDIGAAVSGLALLRGGKHLAYMESVLERSRADMSLKRVAEAACLALLSSAEPRSLSVLTAWIGHAPIIDARQMSLLALALPVEVALRCCAVLAGRPDLNGPFQNLQELIQPRTEARLNAARLSPAYRANLLQQLDELLRAQILTTSGRRFCLRQMGRIGRSSDRDRIRVLGVGGLEVDAEEAVQQIESRMRNGIN
jgi:hypothetical protein